MMDSEVEKKSRIAGEVQTFIPKVKTKISKLRLRHSPKLTTSNFNVNT